MTTIKQFEEIKSWQNARDLTRVVYQITSTEKFSKDYALKDQIRRAAISIMSNIAEGYERCGNREFSQFLSLAQGSCGELRSQLYIAKDQGYLREDEFEQLSHLATKTSKMIAGFAHYLKGSEFKGLKFK